MTTKGSPHDILDLDSLNSGTFFSPLVWSVSLSHFSQASIRSRWVTVNLQAILGRVPGHRHISDGAVAHLFDHQVRILGDRLADVLADDVEQLVASALHPLGDDIVVIQAAP